MATDTRPAPQTFRAVGERAFLVGVTDPGVRAELIRRLVAARIPHATDVVPAAETVLVVVDSEAAVPTAQAAVRDALAESQKAAAPRGHAPADAPDGEIVDIPVRYDGEDLDVVATHLGITAAEVVERHTGQTWTVDFQGFMPGFAYLRGANSDLTVPRRESPRTRIPAGSIALAGDFTGTYPQASPGGWQLIGTTDAVLWDVERTPPALLPAGARVRFVDVTGTATTPETPRADSASTPPDAEPDARARDESAALRVEAVGAQCLVEDRGRPGYAGLGVTTSGAMDQGSHTLANRLLGNDESAATLEALFGGLTLRALRTVTVAVTGASAPVTINGRTQDMFTPLHLTPGDVLAIGTPTSGLRCYVAVRGGIDAAPTLGSRSSDPTTGLGPAPLGVGDALTVGALPAAPIPGCDVAAVGAPRTSRMLTLTLGPREDWFTDAALAALATETWQVSADTDRVGVRLDGPALERSRTGELASEGMVRGAVQVPPSGLPVVFASDHPTTGGYPVVGVLSDADVDWLAQARPGTPVRFRVRHPAERL